MVVGRDNSRALYGEGMTIDVTSYLLGAASMLAVLLMLGGWIGYETVKRMRMPEMKK